LDRTDYWDTLSVSQSDGPPGPVMQRPGHKPGQKGGYIVREKHKGNKTARITYSKLVGYDFGSDGYFSGKYYDEYTNKTQYEFVMPDGSSYITDYKGFREIIDKYDYPKK